MYMHIQVHVLYKYCKKKKKTCIKSLLIINNLDMFYHCNLIIVHVNWYKMIYFCSSRSN